MSAFEAGEAVRVKYTGYVIEATVLSVDDRHGWVTVRQDSDYEDQPEAERPVFEAGIEYVYRPHEDEPLGPFEGLVRLLQGRP